MLFTVADARRSAASLLADDHGQAPAHGCGDGDHNSFITSSRPATTLSRNRFQLAVTIHTSQPIARGSQIPIAPARRSSAPLRCATPARGFLPRGLSDACPRSAPHRQATGRHLITLNDSSRSRTPIEPQESTLSRHSRAQADGMSRRHIGRFKARLAD